MGVAVCGLASALLAGGTPALSSAAAAPQSGVTGVSVLVYHRVAPAVTNEMTVRPSTFQSQLDYLKEHHYPIVPL
ncbi:MAG: polysaccharide deacetylase family protein, partial [Acidobacteria bacterium]|nr:polysaccharide deacetylase family protein [Acidobacteriota bacterium]